jgi:hypothetical protein
MSTLAEIAQLVSLKENPPDAQTYKTLPTQAQAIPMALHIHAQERLTLISKISRGTVIQPRKQKSQRHTTHD